jgi:hypothetical protein
VQCTVFGRGGVGGAGGPAYWVWLEARDRCLFAWNFNVTRSATVTERRIRPNMTLH